MNEISVGRNRHGTSAGRRRRRPPEGCTYHRLVATLEGIFTRIDVGRRGKVLEYHSLLSVAAPYVGMVAVRSGGLAHGLAFVGVPEGNKVHSGGILVSRWQT